MAQEFQAMPAERITAYEEKFFSILKQGKGENKGTAHKYAKKEEAALLSLTGRLNCYNKKMPFPGTSLCSYYCCHLYHMKRAGILPASSHIILFIYSAAISRQNFTLIHSALPSALPAKPWTH